MKNCTPLWREAHFQVKIYEAHHSRTTFGSCDVEKSARRCCAKHVSKSKTYKAPQLRITLRSCDVEEVHAVVARSQVRTTFGSCDVEKVHAVVAQSTCRGQKCEKLTGSEPLLEVEMSKKVHAVVVRSTFRSQKFKKMTGSEHFWTFRCRFTWQAQGIMHLVNSEQNVRHFLKRWQAWDLCRGSGKMSFAWQARYKRHVRRSGR